MKQLYLAILVTLFTIFQSAAQLTLNPAVDTVHNLANRNAIHTLSAYLTARFNKKEGKAYWLPEETTGREMYDFYDAHYLYSNTYQDIIVLGITQPVKDVYRIKVLFDYTGTDKVKTIWSVNEFYVVKRQNGYRLSNALYNNMQLNRYQTVNSPKITYHFPANYAYKQSLIDSANRYLQAIEQFFGRPLPAKIDYITGATCENVYAILGAEFQAGTLSSTTTFCGYFDSYNRMIVTSGGEYYKHELLRTMNLLYPNAPDLLKSGITCLWGGSANKPMIYHIKKLYPYLQQHPEVFNNLDAFYYYDDETNPGFVFQTIVINYVLKHEGKAALLQLMHTLEQGVSLQDFLKDHEHVTDLRTFFLTELKHYSTQSRLEYDDLLEIK